jgi:hypothetical protein
MREPASPIAKRLKKLREAMGHHGHGGQTSFARFLGISPQRWNNVEKGATLGTDLARLLVSKCPGLDWGWLYSGSRGGLSVSMDQRLNAPSERLKVTTEPSESS